MALVIGPKQDIDPSKPNKYEKEQLIQMVHWLIDQGNTSVKTTSGLGEHLILYSKKFAANGGFQDTTDHTEEWHIWIMSSQRSTSGTNPWNPFGSNAEGAASTKNSINNTAADSEKYYLYTVPSGQTETLFGLYRWDTMVLQLRMLTQKHTAIFWTI